jgi:hypothetical protein
MDTTIVHLSKMLGNIPAYAQVAAVFGTQGKATGLDCLSIRYPDGTETFHLAPVGSRPWLRLLFPWLDWRVEAGLDAEYQTFAFWYSTYQCPLVTKAHSRKLWAWAWRVQR